MKRILVIITVLAFAFAAGCGKKDDKKKDDTSKKKPDDKKPDDKKPDDKKPDDKKPDDKKPDDKKTAEADDVPTEVDFEDKAKEEINKKNLEKELTKIEKDQKD